MPQTAIAILAPDTGPIAAVTPLLKPLGGRAIPMLGKNNLPSEEELEAIVQRTDVGLVCMASPPHDAYVFRFIDLMDAYDKPVVALSDTFGADQRFAERRAKIARMLLPSEVDRPRATKFWNQMSDVAVVTGNPAWDVFRAPVMSAKAARAAIGLGTVAVKNAVGETAQVGIFISGTKKPDINRAMLDATLRATLCMVYDYPEVVIVYGPHPGDETDPTVYTDLAATFKQVPFRVLTCKADEVISGIGAVVHPGNSSVALHASIRGKGAIPVIDCLYEDRIKYLAGERVPLNSTLEAQGMSYLPVSFDDFTNTLGRTVNGSGPELRPPPDLEHIQPGQAAKNILGVLNSF